MRVKPNELKPGDVLLSYGESWLGDLIRSFEEGDYSHAAFFDGKQIVEAGLGGVVASELEEGIKNTTYIDVYQKIGLLTL
ncbi:MAG: hypothetical protein AB4426_01020 [Xenococcaceae cyanobacterium]